MINGLANDALPEINCDEDDAFIRQVYELFYRPLCYFAKHLIVDGQESEDIVVNCLIKVLGKRNDFDTPRDAKSFLFTAVRNACFDYLRQSKTKNKYAKEQLYLVNAIEEFGNEEMIKAKVLQTIYTEIEALPPQCKSIFKAIFIEEKSTNVIAEEMAISKQTVLNQKTTALRVLRAKLHQQGLYTLTVVLLAQCWLH